MIARSKNLAYDSVGSDKEASGSDKYDIGSYKDNKDIVDDGTSQQLSYKDIHDMKDKGLSGQVWTRIHIVAMVSCMQFGNVDKRK